MERTAKIGRSDYCPLEERIYSVKNEAPPRDMQFNAPVFKLAGISILLLGSAGKIPAVSDAPSFEIDIFPVLYPHCFGCHRERQRKPKGKLRLDSAGAPKGSDVIVLGRPDGIELMRRVSLPHHAVGVMPPLKRGAQPCSDAERVFVEELDRGRRKSRWL